MIQPYTIDLDMLLDFANETGSMIIDIWHMFNFTVNGHTYSGFLVLISILVFYFMIEWIWGDNDGDD